MSNIERRRTENLPATRPTPSLPNTVGQAEGLATTPVFTRRDARLDRCGESRHLLVVRQMQRQAIEGAAIEARNAYVEVAAMEARRRVLTEAKYQLHRARKESQILAGDDLELAAKFAQLDDDYFQVVRMTGMEGAS